MVSVIVLLQLRAGLSVGLSVVQCEGPDILVEVPEELGFAHAADVGVFFSHRDILQVVEVAEDADLAELGDPREECEADVSVFGFQGAIERFQNLLVFFLEFSVADSLEKGLVIFVHQDDCPFSCRDGGASDDSCEPSGETDFGIIGAIRCLPTCQSLVENILQCRDRVIVLCIEIKMEDRIPFPLLLERGDSQPVEELTLPLEVCLEGATSLYIRAVLST